MKLETTFDCEMTGRLERLACGELDEAARRPLLAWLDAEPRRWRLCGIAFLEAQAWAAVLGEWGASPAEHTMRPIMRQQADIKSRWSFKRAARIAALAASLVVAFALGRGVRPGATLSDVHADASSDARAAVLESGKPAVDTVLASLLVQSPLGAAPPTTIHIPVVPSASQTAVNGLDDVPEYVRQQWERRGYRVTTERRYLFAKLPDGKQVVVPVDQVFVRPVPAEVY